MLPYHIIRFSIASEQNPDCSEIGYCSGSGGGGLKCLEPHRNAVLKCRILELNWEPLFNVYSPKIGIFVFMQNDVLLIFAYYVWFCLARSFTMRAARA